MPEILKAKVRFISLVPRGANQMPVMYKSEDSTVSFCTLLKDDHMEEGLLTAIAYSPGNTDSQGDFASPEVIKKMAHDFMVNGEGVDIRHDSKALAKEDATVVESFIIQKDDPRFLDMKDYSGDAVDVTDGWGVVLKIDNEDLRKEYREGKWNGVSMGGTVLLDTKKESGDDAALAKLFKMFRGLLGQDNQGDLDMKATEVQKMIDDSSEKQLEKMTDLLKENGVIKDTKKSDKDAPKAPMFKGDMSSESDRNDHKKALAMWKAEQDYADDAVALFDALEKIEEDFAESASDTDKEAGIEKEDTPEVKTLKRKLLKAQKVSNQSTLEKSDDDHLGDLPLGMSKEDMDLVKDAQDCVRSDFKED